MEKIEARDAVEPVLGPLDNGFARQLRMAELEGIQWGDLPDELTNPAQRTHQETLQERLQELEQMLRAPNCLGRWKIAAEVEDIKRQLGFQTPLQKRPRFVAPPPAPAKPKANANGGAGKTMWAALEDDSE